MERKKTAAILILNTFVSIADILSIALLFLIIRFYTNNSSLHFLSFIIPSTSFLPAILLFILFAIKSGGGYYVGKLQYQFIHAVSARLSETALIQYMEGSYQNHVASDTGMQIRRVVYTPTEFAQFILLGILQLFTESILAILAATTLLIYSPVLALTISLILLPGIFLLSRITRKKLSGIKQDIKTANEQSLRYLNEALEGYVESNLHNKNTFFTNRYAAMQRKVGNHIANLQISQGLPSRFFELFAIAGLSLLIITTLITKQPLSMVTLGAFVAAAYKIIPTISRITNIKAQLNTYGYTVDELQNIAIEKRTPTTHQPVRLDSISFNDISFSYNDQVIINNLSFDIHTGAFVGISGDSGIGKTTLLNLLLGFLSPRDGVIAFNDSLTSQTERKYNWTNISYVQQSPFLAQDSIINNIVLFDAQYDKARLANAIVVAGLHKVADVLPDGMHTIIKEGGRNLSGGQRQRIAIARALYKDADLLLLDEPFNELDEITEAGLLSHLQQLAANGKMIMLITHNKNSFRYCSKIIQLHAS